MSLNEMAKEAHQIAVEHGWWDKEPTFGELVALMHSELSEALEEYRDGRPMVWRACMTAETDTPCLEEGCGDWNEGKCELTCLSPKPEGIAVELADCIIRILDLMGGKNLDVEDILIEAENTNMPDVPLNVMDESFGNFISRQHLLLSLSFKCWCCGTPHFAFLRMGKCLNEIYVWLFSNLIDPYQIIREKMDYNRTRSYRHGGKVL